MNRETWLNELAKRMAPRFEELGFPLPKFRVSIGFTSGGKNSNANGECWHSRCSADDSFEIFITPIEADTQQVAAILAHELAHTAVGFDQGHKGKFVQVLKALGLKAPWTASVPTPAFGEYIAPFVEELGQVPHARLKLAAESGLKFRPGKEVPADAGGSGESDGEPVSTRPKTQTTRLKKCQCTECGYTVRVTAKWLEVGAPHCPTHGEMQLAGED